MTNACSHDFTSLAFVKSLFFDLCYKCFDFIKYFRSCRQACLKIVLVRDLIIHGSEGLLIICLFFNDVPFLQRESLEGLFENLLSMHNWVSRESNDDLTDAHDGTMANMQRLAEHIINQWCQYVSHSSLRVEHWQDWERLSWNLSHSRLPVFELNICQILEHVKPVFIELAYETTHV